MAGGGACWGPGAVGVQSPVTGDCYSLPPLPTPAVANKFSVEGARSVSIGAWLLGGSPGGGYLSGGTPLAEELAMASVREAMVIVAGSTGGSPGGGYLSGGTPPTEELAMVSVGEAMVE